MKFMIHEDGSFDLIGSRIGLMDCYPAVEGRPVRPISLSVASSEIVYQLAQGRVTLSLAADEDGRLCIGCSAVGLNGIHDINPIGSARVIGADHAFVQGFGMEGPSGCYALGAEIPTSFGLSALYCGEGALLAYAEDHRRYTVRFQITENKAPIGSTSDFSAGFNLEGTAGADVKPPRLYLEESAGLYTGLQHCAGRIADHMGARHDKAPAFFWSSWYYAYETMDQKTLEENLAGMKAENTAFQYVELDAGYMTSLGDWLKPNHRWPGGLNQAAETILNAGFQPGIWVAPFIVGDRSDLYRDHPDWVLHGRDGKPVIQLRSYTEPKIWGNPDCDYFVLDTSNPEALRYLADVFQTLKSWGFRLFKTDFMIWNMHDTATVRRWDPSKTSVEILRNTLSVIRTAIGEESFLLGCIAPFMPFIGFADGMRLAGDCGAQWAEPYGPVNMLRELPCDSYFNHVFWQNDPDAVLLREFASMLRPEEVRSLALLQALSGGVVSTSDPVHRMAEDRKQLLRLIQPRNTVTPQLPYFGIGKKELVLLHRLEQGNILFVMNPTDAPLTVFCRLSEFFGEGDWYQYRYSWDNKESVHSVQDDIFAETLPPHECALVFVTTDPLRRRPENLWTWEC